MSNLDVKTKADEAPISEEAADCLHALESLSVDQATSPASVDNLELLLTASEGEEHSMETEREGTPVAPEPKEPKIRLNGAARKRFRWLLEKGHAEPEARKLALQPMRASSEKGPKRTRSDGSTPPREAKKPKIVEGKKKQPSPIVTFKHMAESVKIGILAKSFPETLLSTDQLTAVQSSVLDEIVLLKEGAVKPKFLSSTFKPGFIVITCADKATADWLKSIVSQLKPWEGADLMAVEEKDIPRPEILVAFFPNSAQESNERILHFIGAQNEGLKVSEWRILNRGTEKTSANLTFSVDQLSAENLKKRDYVISFKFGLIQLRPKRSSATPKAEAGETSKEGNKPTSSSPTVVKAPSTEAKPHTSKQDAEQSAGGSSMKKSFEKPKQIPLKGKARSGGDGMGRRDPPPPKTTRKEQ